MKNNTQKKFSIKRRNRLSGNNKAGRTMMLLTIGLVLLGLLSVADASAPQAQTYFGDSFFFAKQQFMWSIVGIISMIIVSRIDYHILKQFAVPIFIFSIVCLIAVLIPGIGSKALGARRWISLGPASFQPSELVKLAIAIYFARLADANKSISAYVILLAAIAMLIMLQPDLGTTLIVVGIGFIQLFISGVSLTSLLTVLGGGALSALALILVSDYRRDRLLTFLGIAKDHQGTSYHINQVLIALGSGGLFGVGIGQSRQKYLFLPESATDSVFAVLAEEVGFVGCLLLITFFLFFLYKGIRIARSAPDKFGMLLATGIVSWMGVQFFLNLSSMLALTPLTGVPLPFFSYGGSSLTMILISIGILINISTHAKQD